MSSLVARRAATHLATGAVLAVALVGLMPQLATAVALVIGVAATVVVGVRRSLGAAVLMVVLWMVGAALAAAAFIGLLLAAFAGGAQFG